VLELQYAKKNTLLNSKGFREFVLQNCPYHSFRSQVWVGTGGISAGSSLPLYSPVP